MAEDVFQLVGSVVAGVYLVEDVVAEGGFAVVYKAHHAGFDAKVALKCLKIPQHMSESRRAKFKEQFQEEAQLLFRLSASIPNVVRPLHIDAITAPNGRFMPFMALEWLEGQTLDAMAMRAAEEGRGLGPLDNLVQLLTPAAQALHQAHHFRGDHGPISIVHRDVKPENLFAVNQGGKIVVKVLDFGIAKAKSAATQAVGKASANATAFTSFTPAFGAPEQWLPKRFGQTGPWTDVWGLALTTVELLAGRPILDGDQAEMMGAALDPGRRPTPRNEGIAVSDEIERVFAKALALDPRDRYQDAGSFWRELEAAVTAESMERDEATRPAEDATVRHGELDLGELDAGPKIELASVPPSRSQELALAEIPQHLGVNQKGALQATRPRTPVSMVPQPRFSDIPMQLPPVTIRPAAALWRACIVPGAAVIAGIVLAALGQYYAASSGRVFTLGPLRLGWFTIPLVVAGSGVLLGRLLHRGGAAER